jgi:ribosomal protein S18 acetylase RimI-like enzyme
MRPDHRGRGLALRLVEIAIREFPARARYLMATTAPENTAAQRILNDFGFDRQGDEVEVSGQRRLLFVRDLAKNPK